MNIKRILVWILLIFTILFEIGMVYSAINLLLSISYEIQNNPSYLLGEIIGFVLAGYLVYRAQKFSYNYLKNKRIIKP